MSADLTGRPLTRAMFGAPNVLLACALVLSTFLSARGITDEAAVSLHGDMPRHMMNGVFLFDALRSGAVWSVQGAVDFAQEYFVRYPALSLGHHPPLLAVLLVPFFAVFGVSVFAARLAIVACVLVANVGLFSVTRRLYGATAAGWTSLLFAAQSFVVPYGQQVMSEAPLLAVVLLAVDALLRFRLSERTRDYAVFVLLAAATLYAKQIAIFMFPTFALTLVVGTPWLRRRLLRRDVLLLTLLGAAATAPIVAATFILSPYNVAVVANTTATDVSKVTAVATGVILPSIFDAQLSLPLLIALIGGLGLGLARRDTRLLFVLFWIAMVIGGVALVIGPYEAPRYAVLAVPAYCLCAASLVTVAHTRWRLAVMAGLAFVVVWDATAAAAIRPVGAGGYEEAATFTMTDRSSPTILYSASVDTGYFVFFVRKHDPAGHQVVLRADKMLTTSMMGDLSVEERIEDPGEIYAILNEYGTRFVVIEDRATGSTPIDWLRDELYGDQFVERLRVPIETSDRRLRDVDLVVFEYLAAVEPNPDAVVDVNLPIIGRGIQLRLSDIRHER